MSDLFVPYNSADGESIIIWKLCYREDMESSNSPGFLYLTNRNIIFKRRISIYMLLQNFFDRLSSSKVERDLKIPLKDIKVAERIEGKKNWVKIIKKDNKEYIFDMLSGVKHDWVGKINEAISNQ